MIRTGDWLGTQSGRGLSLVVDRGRVGGWMQTAHGRPSPEEKFEIVGFTDGMLIGFSVLWKTESKHYRSVTSWSGRYFEEGPGGAHPEGEYIDASWHLCRMHSDREMKSENEVWESYLSGKSLFRLAPG